VRWETDPDDADTTMLVDDSARVRAVATIVTDVVALSVASVLAWGLWRLGPAGAFVAVIGLILLVIVLVGQRLRTRVPLVLGPAGLELRVIGAGLRVQWDAVERIDSVRARWPSRSSGVAFHLRPGVEVRGLIHRLGWRGRWLIRQNVAIAWGLPDAAIHEVLTTASELHRARLARTVGTSVPAVPPFSA
jgi:hypothetical protein